MTVSIAFPPWRAGAAPGFALAMFTVVAAGALAQGIGGGMFDPKYNEPLQDQVYDEQRQFRPEPPPKSDFRSNSAADPLFDPRFKPYDYDDPVKWRRRERDREQGNVNPGAVDPVILFRL